MVLRIRHDASTRPQAKAANQQGQNEHSSLGSSRLTSLGPDLENEGEESECSSSTMNPDSLAKKAPRSSLSNDRNPSVGSNRIAGIVSLPPEPKNLVSQGKLRSHTGTIRSGRRQGVLRCPVIQRDTENGFFSPGDSSDITPNAASWVSSARSETSSSRIANQLRDENQGELLQQMKKQLASLEKEKKLISLTQNLNEMEAEKAAGFSLNNSSILSKSPEEVFI